MNRSTIAPNLLQEMLDSASNAGAKGQAQYFTPVKLGQHLASFLPEHRPVIVDLTCGRGDLLHAAANRTTEHLLGIDIDPVQLADRRTLKLPGLPIRPDKINGDLTRLYPLLWEADFKADLFVLNPPWDLHFHREHLVRLEESEVEAVRTAFGSHDGRTRRDTIDSTIATLLIALDRGTQYSEGVLLANTSTVERLLLNPGAPHSPLVRHLWAHAKFPLSSFNAGNPDSSLIGNSQSTIGNPTVSALFFAVGHTDGLPPGPENPPDRRDRNGAEIYSGYNCHKETYQSFVAVADEWPKHAAPKRTDYNVYLTPGGSVATHLSLYDNAALERKPYELQAEARELHKLNGRSPMQLVLQRADRDHLQRAAQSTTWRVDPDLQAAVSKAIADYHAHRAPLYPLPTLQRLGYLDEQDTIICRQTYCLGDEVPAAAGEALRKFISRPDSKTWDNAAHYVISARMGTIWQLALSVDEEFREAHPLGGVGCGANGHPIRSKPCDDDGDWSVLPDPEKLAPFLSGAPLFIAGHSYQVTTETIEVIRQSKSPNLAGENELLELTGQELLIFVHDEEGTRRTFVDPRVKQHKAIGDHASAIERALPLQVLLDHFEIPEVPDVAASNPAAFTLMQECLASLESCFTNPNANCRKFQREDLSRAAMHDGATLGWDTGLGKTRAGILFPLLKVGWTTRPLADSNHKSPSPPSDWGEGRGEVEVVPKEPVLIIAPGDLHSQMADEIFELFGIRIIRLDSQSTYQKLTANGPLAPAFYLSSYTEIAINGTRRSLADPAIGNRQSAISHPSLASLIRTAFACVVIDEGVRIKGKDSIIGRSVRSLSPRFRLVLTGTPIKNRLPDIYWLLWWSAGGHDEATARWPYTSDPEEQNRFAETFLIEERNLTKEANSRRNGENRRFKKRTPQVCNIHRLWKLLAPVVLRRRKDNIGEDIVPKIYHRIRVPLGKEQKAVYEYHLKSNPLDKEGRPAIGAKLNALRFAAGAPASAHLHQVADGQTVGTWRSSTSHTPKLASALSLLQQLLSQGQQVLVGSAILDPLDVISHRLTEAGIPHLNLDGRLAPGPRGKLARQFKAGRAGGIPVALCGLESMAEGHNFFRCSHAVILCYSWAMDKVEQYINRIHRLNSPFPVHVWCLICDGTIERKQECLLGEKTDGADLALDGILLDREYKDVSLAEMLAGAADEFDPDSKTIDEATLLAEWPALRESLTTAFTTWKSLPIEPASVPSVESALAIATAAPENIILLRARQLLAA